MTVSTTAWQILPASWVHDTRLGNDRLRELFANSDYRGPLPNGHYRTAWADRVSDELMCIGIPAKSFTSTAPGNWSASNCHPPVPDRLALYGATYRALRALAAQL